MRKDKLDQMSRVTEAVYYAEYRKIQVLLQEESRLRKALARLQEQSEAERQTLATDMPMQSIGADLLWQGWLERSRKELNVELSQVLAKKSTAMDRVRRAFGRSNAVQTMHDKFTSESAATRRKAQMENLLRSHLGT